MNSTRACPICGEPFVRTDTVVYLRAEDVLLHRACCDRHPRCQCVTAAPVPPAEPETNTETATATA